MSDKYTKYSRADILNLKNRNSNGFQIINKQILDTISQTSTIKGLATNSRQYATTKNGLHSKKTKRGCRAGKHKTRQPTQQSTPDPIPAPIVNKTSQSHPVIHNHNHASLPSILFTNCRSLNEWKLMELAVDADTHKPQLICLTETWLDVSKEQSRTLPGYQNFYCHRSNRIGGGVGILAANELKTSVISSHTTSTFSGIWTLSHIENYTPIITACIYHPPDAAFDDTLDYLGETLASLCKNHPLAKFVITGDFNHLPIEDICSQLGIENLINFNTRNDAKLDLVLTNIVEYQPAIQLAPISNNDHWCVFVKSNHAIKPPKFYLPQQFTLK